MRFESPDLSRQSFQGRISIGRLIVRAQEFHHGFASRTPRAPHTITLAAVRGRVRGTNACGEAAFASFSVIGFTPSIVPAEELRGNSCLSSGLMQRRGGNSCERHPGTVHRASARNVCGRHLAAQRAHSVDDRIDRKRIVLRNR